MAVVWTRRSEPAGSVRLAAGHITKPGTELGGPEHLHQPGDARADRGPGLADGLPVPGLRTGADRTPVYTEPTRI